MQKRHVYIGARKHTKKVGDYLGIDKTLLGIDVIENGKLIVRDANEREILQSINGKKAKIIISPLGRQGFIFGRGNQQISEKVIKKVGKDNIIIISTPQKLMYTPHLFIDTGNEKLNKELKGWKSVIVGFGLAIRREVIY